MSLYRSCMLPGVIAAILFFSAGVSRADDAAAKPADGAAADEAGFRPIFNGKNLDGWDGEPGFWSVVDGVITGEATRQKPLKMNSFLVWRDGGDVDDFELKAQYRIAGGNSGIQFRSEELGTRPETGRWRIKGYQADIEAGDTYSGIQYEERGRGILALRGEKAVISANGKKSVTHIGNGKELQSFIKKNDWNEYDVIVRGNHIIQKINGHLTAEVIDNDTQHARRSGLLALQIHAGMYPMKVEFKDLRIKRFKPEGKKIVLVAGHPSHGWGAHEFNAGMILLKNRLNRVPGIVAVSYHNGWPKDPNAFEHADAVVLYMDGGGGHPVLKHLDQLDELAKRGVGIMCMHYAVEVPAGEAGKHLQKWIGGYYETGWSVNPTWTATAVLDSEHPISRGVKPFEIKDEWYFNMRFRDDAEGISKVLQAKPDDEARSGKGGWPTGAKPHILAAKGRMETLMWAIQRPDGGRGVGFTGGHFHDNWANDDFRKLVLNGLVWVAGGEVPAQGIESDHVSRAELDANQDEPKPMGKK